MEIFEDNRKKKVDLKAEVQKWQFKITEFSVSSVKTQQLNKYSAAAFVIAG